MVARRSKLEIIYTVLNAVRMGRHKPTRIMYASNLSWRSTTKILDELVNKKYLIMELSNNSKKSNRSYKITKKGEEIFTYIQKGKKILKNCI